MAMDDIMELVSPISKKKPSGRWARYDNKYSLITAEKNSDDPTLPMGEWERPLKQTDWKRVVDIAEDLLKKETKDLEICVFLIEINISTKALRTHLEDLEDLDENY